MIASRSLPTRSSLASSFSEHATGIAPFDLACIPRKSPEISISYHELEINRRKTEGATEGTPKNSLTTCRFSDNLIFISLKTDTQEVSLLLAKPIISTPQDWHVEDIKAAIRKTGLTLSDLSLAAGFCDGAAARALLTPWPRMEAAIAAHVGRKPHEIWPSRYSPDGRPLAGLHIRRPKNLAPATPPRNVRKVRSNEQRAYA